MSRGPTSITFDRDVLASALGAVVPAVSRSNIALMNCVLIQAGQTTTLTAANEIFQASVDLPSASCDGAVSLAVDAGRLNAIIQTFPSGAQVRIEVDGQSATVVSGRARLKLQGENPEAFPIQPTGELAPVLTIAGSELAEAFNRTRYAAEEADELGIEPWKTGVVLRSDAIGILANTGAKSGIAQHRIAHTCGELRVVVPIKTTEFLGKRLRSEAVAVSLTERSAYFDAGSLRVLSRLVDCDTPDFLRYIPTEQALTAIIDPIALVGAVKRSLLVNDDRGRVIRLAFEGGRIAVSSTAKFGSGIEEIPCDYEDEPITIGIRADQLLAAVAALAPDTLRIGMSGLRKAVLLTGMGNPNSLAVIMPVAI